MERIINGYRTLNILSIDVALGAIISAMFFARLVGASLQAQEIGVLGITVWLIYTADHLLDALRIKTVAATNRHRFHQVHFKVISVICLLLLLLDVALIYYLQASVLMWGFRLSVLVMLYFLVQRKLIFFKELVGSILYSSGVLLPAFVAAPESFSGYVACLALLFVFIAFTNLVLFSLFDQEHDQLHQHSSLTTLLGRKATRVCLKIIFALQLGLSFYVMFTFPTAIPETIIIVAMVLVLFMVFVNERWFATGDRYRLAGDAIFLFPLLLSLWH